MPLRFALLQLDLCWEDPNATFARTRPWLEASARAGARVAVLPEMFPTGFSMAPERIAEDEQGPSETWLQRTAAELGLWIVGGIAQKTDRGAVNAALVVGPSGRTEARYHKVHPFSFAREHEHYRPGDGVRTVEIEGVRLTPVVCYDLRFPELFRAAVDETDVFVVIANWPAPRRAHWSSLLRARAIENQAWVLGVNRVGEGGGLRYAGDSAAVAPDGEIVVAAAELPTMLLVDVEAARVSELRAAFPVLPDRRPEAYRRL